MKVIKVSIEMNGCLQFSGYFTNYPTPEELLLHLRVVASGNVDPRAMIQALNTKQWVICYNPHKVMQFISSFGVVIGKVEMKEVLISECVGFDPRRTCAETPA